MTDLFQFWESFREPLSGLYCDTIMFADNKSCTPGDMYSSAGTGMGLIAECVFAEVGLLTMEDAESRVRQTLANVLGSWPRESFHGFLAHFIVLKGDGYVALSEFSTIDTAELAMGALFAGNYFGGDILAQAQAFAQSVSWSDAIKSADLSTIYPVVDPVTGKGGGNIHPFNEYYIVAYIAQLMDPKPHSKASRYFETYMSLSGKPVGREGYPFHASWDGLDTLTDNPTNHFMSSFIPQFCWFQTKGFHTNHYYEHIFRSWMQADMAYWDSILDEDSEVWGHKIKGRLFGSGAGPGCEDGYTVNRINGTEEPIFSAAIMAGFLGVANKKERDHINVQLQWLHDNDICTYEKVLPNGDRPRVPWRCSIRNTECRVVSADSIDFSTMVLGYSLNFLPEKFYPTYVA